MKYLKLFENTNESVHGEFGEVKIEISGNGFIKSRMVSEIKKSLRKFQGKREIIVDGERTDPNRDWG